jgi:ATP-dependent RNA circularization protein (DNA/RNA ligase family)
VTFGAKTLTHYGGVCLVPRFLSRIGRKHAVAHDIHVGQRNNRYRVGELLLAVLSPLILGLERLETFSRRIQDKICRYGNLSRLFTFVQFYDDLKQFRSHIVSTAAP